MILSALTDFSFDFFVRSSQILTKWAPAHIIMNFRFVYNFVTITLVV